MIESLENHKGSIFVLLLCIVGAVISFTVVANYTSSSKFLTPIMESLEEKKQDVLELTAASTGTSVGITVLPGDIATPIAEKMANISQYLLIVMCAIYLEKYLMTILGFVTFKIMIPLALLIAAAGYLMGREGLRRTAFKIGAFGMAVFLVIPVSVHISDIISDSYRETVQAAISAAEETEAELEGEESAAAQAGSDAKESKESESTGIWDYITGIPETVAEGVDSAVTGASDVTQEKIEELQRLLNNFMESVAVMIITSCVIPILVLLFFVQLIKLIFNGWAVLK